MSRPVFPSPLLRALIRTTLFRIAMVGLAASILCAAPTCAQPAAPGAIVLTVTGAIGAPGGKAEFDVAGLEKIGTARIVTTTPWTEGRAEFEGVLMRDLLKRVGARGAAVTVTALNDYRITIPNGDFTKYPVLLAFRMNGERLRIRDKGPLWIIYPQDDYPELGSKPTHAKWVWQIKEIRVD